MTTHFTDSTGVCVLLKKTLRSMDEIHSMKTVSLEVVGRKYLKLLLQTELEMLPFCIVFISVLLVSLYLFIRRQYSYWERNNVPFVQPKFPFGNISIISENITQQFDALYRKNKGQNAILGVVVVVRPVLLLIDLELVRRVFIKDFQYFKNRGMFYNAKDDPLSANLLTLEYEKSSLLRSKLSSTFSSGKMKFMFPTIVAIANKLVDSINEMIKTDNKIEFHDLISRFATDVIANCVFGIECNSVRNPNAEFRKMGKRIFDKPELSFMKLLLASAYPTLARLLRVRVQPKCISDYFMNLACETIEYREKNNVQRNDFMDLLIRVKNSQTESDGLTMNEIAAQAFVFFTNGFEGPALTLTYCLYELSLEKNKRIQEKAWQEIQTVLERHNGNLTYEAMNEMTYCEQIINESLRKFPLGTLISRVATKPYRVPATEFTIPKGMFVLTCVRSIHYDPAYYDDPEEFIPERFSPEEIKKRPSCSFMPFGDGPRNCIALRFSMIQIRIGLIYLLKNFEFSTCSRTNIPLEFCPKKPALSPKHGIWLKVNRHQ